MDYPWVRRLVKTWVAFVVLAVVFLFVWTAFVRPRLIASWEAEFLGLTESEVVGRIGKPSYEERKSIAPSEDFSLHWSSGECLEFRGGVVVRRTRSSR